MKSRICASLLIACLPWLAMAQSNDDLYFIPKKEKKTEQKAEVKSVPKQTSNNTTVYAAPGSTIVVKDVTGKTRDIDEYNRRYTSRDNTFSMQNDTLYIEEKPYGERGEWVNGFEGSQDDYEYAMRIIRFRSPRYAIPVSSPLYWDVVYGGYASWDWNIYEDGLYAYVFPTSTNPLWWDWRWNWGVAGPRWGFSWGWSSPWYYSSWYSPYWYGGYWSNDPSLHTITAALGNCVAAQALVWGSFAGIITAFFMYIPRKIMTFKEFMDNFTKGMQQMITSGCILMLAWTIGGVCRVFT